MTKNISLNIINLCEAVKIMSKTYNVGLSRVKKSKIFTLKRCFRRIRINLGEKYSTHRIDAAFIQNSLEGDRAKVEME